MSAPHVNDFNEIFSTLKNYDNHIAEQHIQKYKELDKLLPINNTFFIITDTQSAIYPFVSSNFKHNLGLDPEKMQTEGIGYWLAHFHPDEVQIFIGILDDMMKFTIMEVKPEDRPKLSYTWTHRIRTSKGNYLNLFELLSPIVLDEDYKPIMGVTTATVVGDGEEMPMEGSIKLLNDNNEYETIYVKNYSQKLIAEGLSNRERDILRLLILNKTSKEIAESLFISSHTVDTHRRNIIKKTGLSSTAELSAYFKRNLLY